MLSGKKAFSGSTAASVIAAIMEREPEPLPTSVTDAVQSMGLKLESRQAMVDQFVVDHVEKPPTEN